MTTVVWPHRANPILEMMSDSMIGAGSRGYAEESPRTLRVVMAGGGTGGHLYPGLAVGEALRELAAEQGLGLELIWAATPRAVDQRLLTRFGDQYVKQPVQPLVKSIKKLWGFVQGWRASCAMWAERLKRGEIDAVVALGGYAAGPAAYVVSKRNKRPGAGRVPVVLLNPDALPGLANRFLLKRADVIVTQWPLAKEYESAVEAGGGKVKALGCPIRTELVGRTRAEGAKRLGVEANRRTLVVTGASLGAKTINDAVLKLLEDTASRAMFETPDAEGWQIIHLAGTEQAAAVRLAYAKWDKVRAKVIDYCDDMASVWAVADLAIARAGASTCAELTACGVPSILMPYPFHKDMHQRANADELAANGAAIVVEDVKNAHGNARAVKTALDSVLYGKDTRERMAAAARAAGKPHAAAEIAREILALIQAPTR